MPRKSAPASASVAPATNAATVIETPVAPATNATAAADDAALKNLNHKNMLPTGN